MYDFTGWLVFLLHLLWSGAGDLGVAFTFLPVPVAVSAARAALLLRGPESNDTEVKSKHGA